ncbi:MAG: TerB family tellurite resistance protein [Thiobacillaceae bacterium]
MFEKFQSKLHDFIETFAPSPETRMRREMEAIQQACCQLLMEVARLAEADTRQKRDMVAQVMREQFDMSAAELRAMIDIVGRPENRLTAYYDQVRLINERFDPARKTRFIEQLWRVAAVDGDIDMYEDNVVRKLADLLYVPHSDFILAKNRVRAQVIPQPN